MSDNIPFEIQMEIIKWLPVKPLIQFRSVSKPWKSFIDSSQFINWYGARNTQPHSRILSYKSHYLLYEAKYLYVVYYDNNETFKVQQEFAPSVIVSPLLKQYQCLYVVGACHGLLCLSCYNKDNYRRMLVIWNHSIGKSFGIALPVSYYYSGDQLVFGFGACPVTRDLTIVKIIYVVKMPWHVEVFTLSSGVWNVIPSSYLPRQSVRLNPTTQAVIDKFIYWGACEKTFTDDGESTTNHMVVSFDLIAKEFKVVDLPDSLAYKPHGRVPVFVSKLRGSLVVYGSINVDGAESCGVWVMQHDLSFKKLFSIGAQVDKILGFRESGEPIFETVKEEDKMFNTLAVYDPCSQQINNLGIDGSYGTFAMSSYKESLLLLNHSDLHIYCDDI